MKLLVWFIFFFYQFSLIQGKTNLDQICDTALEYLLQGNYLQSTKLLQSILTQDPKHVDANQLMGSLILKSGGNTLDAINYFQKAIQYNNRTDLNLIANYIESLRIIEHYQEAYEIGQQYLPMLSQFPEKNRCTFYLNYGLIERSLQINHHGFPYFQQAAQFCGKTMFNPWKFGIETLFELQLYEEAEQYVLQALQAYPNHYHLYYYLGTALHHQKKLDEALHYYQYAEQLNSSYIYTKSNIAAAYQGLGLTQQALNYYEQVVPFLLQDAGILNNYGALLGTMNRHEEEVYWLKKALLLDPYLEPALVNLAGYYQDLAQLNIAEELLQRATKKSTSRELINIHIALLMSPISETWEQMTKERNHMKARLLNLIHTKQVQLSQLQLQQQEGGGEIEVKKSPVDSSLDRIHFYIPYHSLNDRNFQELVVQTYRYYLSDVNLVSNGLSQHPIQISYTQSPDLLATLTKTRRRIGFISKFFGVFEPHGMLLDGVMKYLPRDQFEIICLTIARTDGKPVAPTILESCHEVITISLVFQHAFHIISNLRLDVLIFADLVSEPINHFSALNRIAPVQLAFWGNPLTSGSETIDYFISADIMEHPYRTRMRNTSDPYTEQVVLMEGQGIWYFRPSDVITELSKAELLHRVKPLVNYTRVDFNLSSDWFVYLLPQSVFKIHPLYDLVLKEILLRSPNNTHLVVTGGRKPAWTQIYMNRLNKALGPELQHRLHLIERVSSERFYSLLEIANVILHPFPFDGSRTSADALIVQIPYVTLPSEYLRGRMGFAFLRTMNISELVAIDIEDYIEISVKLAYDSIFYQNILSRIRQQVDLIWEDMSIPFTWTNLLQQVTGLPISSYETFLQQTGRNVSYELERTDQRDRNAQEFDRIYGAQTWMLSSEGIAVLEPFIDNESQWPWMFETWRNSYQQTVRKQPSLNTSSQLFTSPEPTERIEHKQAKEIMNIETRTKEYVLSDQLSQQLTLFFQKMELIQHQLAYSFGQTILLQLPKTFSNTPINPITIKTIARFYLEYGLLHYSHGQYQLALEYCTQGLTYAPRSSLLHICIGIASIYVEKQELLSYQSMVQGYTLYQQYQQSSQLQQRDEIQSNIVQLDKTTMQTNLYSSFLRAQKYDVCWTMSQELFDLPSFEDGGGHIATFALIQWSKSIGKQVIDLFETTLKTRYAIPPERTLSLWKKIQEYQQKSQHVSSIVYECIMHHTHWNDVIIQDLLLIIQQIHSYSKQQYVLQPHSPPMNLTTLPPNQQITLITQYYLPTSSNLTNDWRQEDMNYALLQNLNNPYIHTIVMLTEEYIPFEQYAWLPQPLIKQKLQQMVIHKRLSFQDAFQYANQYLIDRIVILANADIYFDHTLQNLIVSSSSSSTSKQQYYQSIDTKTFLSILKWSNDNISFNRLNLHLRTDSQDAWIFRSPIESPSLIQESNFYLGLPRCDNRLAYLLLANNYTVKNVPWDIHAIEIQRSPRIGSFYGMNQAVSGLGKNLLIDDKLLWL